MAVYGLQDEKQLIEIERKITEIFQGVTLTRGAMNRIARKFMRYTFDRVVADTVDEVGPLHYSPVVESLSAPGQPFEFQSDQKENREQAALKIAAALISRYESRDAERPPKNKSISGRDTVHLSDTGYLNDLHRRLVETIGGRHLCPYAAARVRDRLIEFLYGLTNPACEGEGGDFNG